LSSMAAFLLLMAAIAADPTPAPPPPPPVTTTPFRLGLTYTHVASESGDLVNDGLSTNAVGIDLVSPSYTYVRDRLALAYQWESQGAYAAKGFRVDLISFGYPIKLYDRAAFRLDLEPVLTVVRPELMFVDGGGKFLRVASAFGVAVSATWNHWFLDVRPLEIEFRYWVYASTDPKSQTGLGRIFPIRVALGHEF